jgi:hypothetical protein
MLNRGEPGDEPHPRPSRALVTQSGVTLGWEQGEPGAEFTVLGIGNANFL